MCFDFLSSLSETFLILIRIYIYIYIYDQKCISVFMSVTLYSYPILIKLEFSWRVLEKCWYVKFDKNTSSGSRVVTCRETDRHDEANSHFSQFCEHAYKCSHWVKLRNSDFTVFCFSMFLQSNCALTHTYNENDYIKYRVELSKCSNFRRELLTKCYTLFRSMSAWRWT